MRKSFDLVGDIAIIDSGKGSESLVKKIVRTYPRVKAVLVKESGIKGRHRTRKYRIVYRNRDLIRKGGMGETETVHLEFGCRYKMDLRRVFFSPREGTVRARIAGEIRAGERVLVMFSGVGPYPVLIAKKAGCRVTAIEINPAAVKYSVENIVSNRVRDRVELLHGDVKDLKAPRINTSGKETGKFDRIILPAAGLGMKYLPKAIGMARKGGIVYCYAVWGKDEWEREKARLRKRKIQLLDAWKISSYSPGKDKVCLKVRA